MLTKFIAFFFNCFGINDSNIILFFIWFVFIFLFISFFSSVLRISFKSNLPCAVFIYEKISIKNFFLIFSRIFSSLMIWFLFLILFLIFFFSSFDNIKVSSLFLFFKLFDTLNEFCLINFLIIIFLKSYSSFLILSS